MEPVTVFSTRQTLSAINGSCHRIQYKTNTLCYKWNLSQNSVQDKHRYKWNLSQISVQDKHSLLSMEFVTEFCTRQTLSAVNGTCHRIQYKINTFCCNCITCTVLSYLCDSLLVYTSSRTPRSASDSLSL